MPEWSNGTAWKAVTLMGPVGSNPTPSAKIENRNWKPKLNYVKRTDRKNYRAVNL